MPIRRLIRFTLYPLSEFVPYIIYQNLIFYNPKAAKYRMFRSRKESPSDSGMLLTNNIIQNIILVK
ncbi:hypothetical protein HMPREF0239_01231 [Clostridium sp. ATCC BAA-442]|nr:hypothetical protein HMPREF0239_01231 [Clostridium sp. ATCC BAA-442]